MSFFVPPASRNAPCPCGSGLRYKLCHGALRDLAAADDLQGRLVAADARLAALELDEAERIAEAVLASAPDHPQALRVIAHVRYERGDPQGALDLLLRALRKMQQQTLPPAAQYAIWTSVNYMFTQALAGTDARDAGELRARYQSWDRRRAADVPATISVVLALGDGGFAPEQTVASLLHQERRPDEVVIAHAGAPRAAEAAMTALRAAGLRAVTVDAGKGASSAATLNAAVARAGSEYVALLTAPHAYAPERLRALVDAVTRYDYAWGFGMAAFFGDGGQPREDDPRALKARAMLEGIAEADTIGFTLLHQEFVALSAANLWFRRDFFARVGPLRERHFASDWEWCLRAVWEAEPGYLAEPLYRHHLPARDPPIDPERGQAIVAMFRDYYARAADPGAVPPNPYAPALSRWGLHFLKTPFQVGHVLAFSVPELEGIAGLIAARRTSVSELTPGVNLVGFVFGEFGLGESLRALAAACDVAGIPFIVKDVDMRLRSRQADRTLAPHVSDTLRHRASLYCVNPDMMKPINASLRVTRDLGGRNIGYFYWELETVPAVWDASIRRMDEIWVATEFVAAAMRRAFDGPVVTIPPPIEPQLARPYARAEFGLPERTFLFLFSFDFNSFLKRKNPEAAVRAFRMAFPASRTDVGLVIKSTNGHVEPAKLRALQDVVGGDPRIIVMDRFLSRDEVYGLLDVVDSYVSLHRAEGLGLGLAESMYFGKPVIGTAYSGNTAFMNAHNSVLVRYRLVPVLPGEYLYDDARFRWADPDVEEAAAGMRRLVDDAQFRARIALAGRETIRTRFTRARTGALVRARLSESGLL